MLRGRGNLTLLRKSYVSTERGDKSISLRNGKRRMDICAMVRYRRGGGYQKRVCAAKYACEHGRRTSNLGGCKISV